ncbi:hypothetical protein [Thermococcus sp. CX2]|nr:hypothetical protein [Thermococcus sp. CX2]
MLDQLVMRIGGAITLLGIALTWLTFRNLERSDISNTDRWNTGQT